MAVIRSLNSESGSAIAAKVIMPQFVRTGIINGDMFLYNIGGGQLSDATPFIIPFDGVINMATVAWGWGGNNKDFYIRIWVNGVMEQAVVSTVDRELLTFDVAVSALDELSVEASEVDPIIPGSNSDVWVGLILEET